MVVVEGAAGIGKSRLVAELRRRAEADGIRVLTARAGELERDFPFGVVRQLFEPELADPERRERIFSGAAAAARGVFGALEDDAPDGSFAALNGLFWVALNVAGDRPAVLLVDDLHWCDRASLRFLAYLARRLEGLPLLVAATVRTTAARLEHAKALLALGSVLATDAAIDTLRRAHAVALGCGAVRVADEARDGLRARGTDVSTATPSGLEALTSGERRLAALVASGRTIRDIAQVLFLTPKTVDDRLARAYEKLGVHTPGELGQMLEVA